MVAMIEALVCVRVGVLVAWRIETHSLLGNPQRAIIIQRRSTTFVDLEAALSLIFYENYPPLLSAIHYLWLNRTRRRRIKLSLLREELLSSVTF